MQRSLASRLAVGLFTMCAVGGCCAPDEEPDARSRKEKSEAPQDELVTEVHLSGDPAAPTTRSEARPPTTAPPVAPPPEQAANPVESGEELLAEATDGAATARRGRQEAARAAQQATNAAVAAQAAGKQLDEAAAEAAASEAGLQASAALAAASSAEEGATKALAAKGRLQPSTDGRTVRHVTDAAGAARSDAERARASAKEAQSAADRASGFARDAALGAELRRAMDEAGAASSKRGAEAQEALGAAKAGLVEAKEMLDAGDAEGTERALSGAASANEAAARAAGGALEDAEAAGRRLEDLGADRDRSGVGADVRAALDTAKLHAEEQIASAVAGARATKDASREIAARLDAIRRELEARRATGMHPTMPVVVPPPEERSPVGVRAPAAAPPPIRVVGSWRQVGGETSADTLPGNYSTNELRFRADGVVEIRRSFGDGAVSVTWRVSYRWNADTNSLELGHDPAVRPPASALEPIAMEGVTATKPARAFPVTLQVVAAESDRLQLDGRTFERSP